MVAEGMTQIGEMTSAVAVTAWPLAQETAPLLWRIDPARRHELLLGLMVIVLLGVVLLGVIVAVGRQARRAIRGRLGPTAPDHDAWYQKPLTPVAGKDSPHEPQ